MKMRNAILASALVAISAQAETLKVSDLDVDSILVVGNAEVEIGQEDDMLLQIRGDSDDLDKRPFYIRGDTLVLGDSKEYKGHSFSGLKYKVSLPDLDRISLSGSGDVYVKPVELESLDVNVAGSGDIKLFSLKA